MKNNKNPFPIEELKKRRAELLAEGYVQTEVLQKEEYVFPSLINKNKIMKTKEIDLSTCKKGDILISKHGERLTYLEPLNTEVDYYDHKVKYSTHGLGYGTRTNDGFVMRNVDKRLETDHDIVEIIYV